MLWVIHFTALLTEWNVGKLVARLRHAMLHLLMREIEVFYVIFTLFYEHLPLTMGSKKGKCVNGGAKSKQLSISLLVKVELLET